MNRLIFFILLLQFLIGSLAVYSASGEVGLVIKQCIFFLLASAVYWLLQSRTVIKDQWLQLSGPKAVLLFIVSIGLLGAVLIAGKEVNGARRWLTVAGFAVQPSEFTKVLFLAYFAYLLNATKRKFGQRTWPEGPALISLALFASLILVEPDFGTTALLTCVFCGMLFVAGLPLKRILLYVVALGILGSVAVSSAGYRSKRLEAYQDPWKYRYDAGYQTTSAYEALGTGHWLGVGYRNGTHKRSRLPEAHNDYILAVIGEEVGFVGVVTIISSYLALLGLILFAVFRYMSGWQQLYGAGVFLMAGGAVAMNLYVVSGLMPSKGIALPMISAGGSNLLAFVLMIALFARWAHESQDQIQEVGYA